MAWDPSDKAFSPTTQSSLEPLRVLYEYDGPLVFVAEVGLARLLFYKVDELEAGELFLAVEASDEAIEALVAGRISLRGALSSERYTIVETDLDRDIVRYWPVPTDNLPEDFLPPANIPLYAHMPMAPDSLAQADSYFSMAFKGQTLTRLGMPFAVFKGLINDAYDASRKLLEPTFLQNARSSTFDFDIAPVQFASLVINLSNPIFNEARVLQRARIAEATLDTAEGEMDRLRQHFFEQMTELVSAADAGAVGDSIAARSFTVVDRLRPVLPVFNEAIESVEFSANLLGTVTRVKVGGQAGERIRRAYQQAETRDIEDAGIILIINARSNSFVIQSVRGREVTCYIPRQAFRELRRSESFRLGAQVIVRGRLERRKQRDKLEVQGEPQVWIQQPGQTGRSNVFD